MNVEAAIETARAFLDTHRSWLGERDPLREETAAMIENYEPLVGIWRDYALAKVRGETTGKKGPRRTRYLYRDHCIAEAVYLTVTYGFPAYRSSATRNKGGSESACSIVTTALKRCGVNMSEDAVESIWKGAPSDWNEANRGPSEQ